jgi:methionine synthase II (cobalamin-independent)
LIRAFNHSSFPKIDDSPLDQLLRTTRSRYDRGKIDVEELDSAIDETTTIVVANQGRAFIDVVTDGMIRWDGPISPLASLGGIELGHLVRWFDTNFYERRLVIDGPVRRERPFLVHDFEVAKGVAGTQVVKQVLPGPVTASRLADDRHYEGREPLAEALADALAEEVAELAAAGAECFQLDEPLLCRHPRDLELVARTAATIFAAAGEGATTILSTYFGDLSASGGELDRLPGTHLGLDLVFNGGESFNLINRLPEGRGVALGLFDARTTLQEDASDVAALLEPYRESLMARDVLVGPNAGLELLPRDQAFDKLLHARYLVEKLTKDWEWE